MCYYGSFWKFYLMFARISHKTTMLLHFSSEMFCSASHSHEGFLSHASAHWNPHQEAKLSPQNSATVLPKAKQSAFPSLMNLFELLQPRAEGKSRGNFNWKIFWRNWLRWQTKLKHISSTGSGTKASAGWCGKLNQAKVKSELWEQSIFL